MPLLNERAAAAPDPAQAARLTAELGVLRTAGPHAPARASLTVDDRSITLDTPTLDAVLDLLQRFADGHAVVVGSSDSLLTTSQAAELVGVSATYLLRLANEGVIPVEYRGTHRRFRLADALAYLESSRAAKAAKR